MEAVNNFLANSSEFYLYLGIGGSVIFIIQFIMIMIGMGDNPFDVSGDVDADAIDLAGGGDLTLVSFFSIRSLVAFLTFFGWGGYFWGQTVNGFILALLCGIAMMVLTTLAVYFFFKMQHSGTISDEEFVGQSGTVYISIPGGSENSGMITVNMPNCTRQLKAFADEPIPSGAHVKVVKAVGESYFKVEKL